MNNTNKVVATIFAILAGMLTSYILSGIFVLIFNKVKLLKAIELWHFNFIYEAIIRGYPQTLKSILFATILSAIGIVALILFVKKKQTIFGEARFANMNEIRKSGLFGDKNNYVKRGIIIGKYGNKFLKFGGQQFVALGAPTRSGKGVGIVIPNLLHWEESAVVQDIKQECFDYTSKYRKEKLGNEVFLFNPFSTRTHRYNPLSYVDLNDVGKADLQLMDLANILYPITGNGEGTSDFFNGQAQNLFIGLCYLYKDLKYTKKGQTFLQGYNLTIEFNFYGILQLSKGFDIDIDEETNITGFEATYNLLKGLKILGEETTKRLSTYMQIDAPNTKSGIMASFNAPLTPFEGLTLRLSTQTSDFDLRDLRRKKMTIYIGITPDQLANAKFILNVFWSQLISLNTKEMPQQDKSLKYACLLLMDEFTAPGQLQILQKGVSFIAGYNLRLLTIYQSISQLKTPPPLGYGEQGGKTLLTNHACQIFYAPRELEDAKAISELLGNTTVKQFSRSINTGNSGGGSRSISETHRALMLPQELREMDFSKELITIDSGKPILCDKAFYYSDKFFMNKFKEVSPSLSIIKGVPNRDIFEQAILNNECNIKIPIQQLNAE